MKNYIITSGSKITSESKIYAKIAAENKKAARDIFFEKFEKYSGDDFCFNICEIIGQEDVFFCDFPFKGGQWQMTNDKEIMYSIIVSSLVHSLGVSEDKQNRLNHMFDIFINSKQKKIWVDDKNESLEPLLINEMVVLIKLILEGK